MAHGWKSGANSPEVQCQQQEGYTFWALLHNIVLRPKMICKAGRTVVERQLVIFLDVLVGLANHLVLGPQIFLKIGPNPAGRHGPKGKKENPANKGKSINRLTGVD